MVRSRLAAVVPLCACVALAGCGSDAATPPDPIALSTAYGLPGADVYPEGIALDARTGDTYVGSFATGAVYRAAAKSDAAEVFLPAGSDGRHTANGLKVDGDGRLWVIDSSSGVAVYDLATKALLARFDVPGPDPRFVNDLALTADGTAYLTDSQRNVVYRVDADRVTSGARGELAVAYDLTPTLPPRDPNTFDLNGIAVAPDGTYLLVVAMTSGKLYRVDLTGDAVAEVQLSGGDVHNGDGLELSGDTLWVVHNVDDTISRWTLADDGTHATRDAQFSDPALGIPTTMVHSGDRALVVVSQFDKGGPLGPGTPGPFTVAAVDGI